jgi:hypothetical protein
VLTFGNEHVTVLRTRSTAGCLSYLWRDRLFCGGLLAVDACPFQPAPALPRALWDSVAGDVFAACRDAAVHRPCPAGAHRVHKPRAATLAPLVRGATRDSSWRVGALPATGEVASA